MVDRPWYHGRFECRMCFVDGAVRSAGNDVQNVVAVYGPCMVHKRRLRSPWYNHGCNHGSRTMVDIIMKLLSKRFDKLYKNMLRIYRLVVTIVCVFKCYFII